MRFNHSACFLTHILLTAVVILTGFELMGQESSSQKYPKRKVAKFEFPEGYIISMEGDTTPGYIRKGDEMEEQQKIYFYDHYGAKTTYDANTIVGYGYLDKHYVSRPTPYFFSDLFTDTVVFMSRIIDGPAKLYRYYNRRNVLTLKKGASYFDYLEKPDGRIFEVSYAYKWKRLASAFKDHPSLSKDILEGIYQPEDTESILEYYNQWYLRKWNQDKYGLPARDSVEGEK